MNEKSKLSSRFKKAETDESIVIERPEKFTLENDAAIEENFSENIENKKDLKQELFEKIDSVPVWFDYSENEQKKLIKSFVSKKVTDSSADKNDIAEKLYSEINGFGALDYLLAQENVNAVFVNGTNSVHIEISGKILNTEIKLSEKELSFLTNNLLNKANIKSDNPILNFKLENLIITVIMPEISKTGINISIRKQISLDAETLIKTGMMNAEVFEFILSAINLKKNIIISGDINTGKTAFLNVLLDSAVKNRRSVLLEDNSYISCESDTLMKFSADKNLANFNKLVSNILKMAPEYIVTDLNEPIVEISEACGVISTLRAASVESAVSKLVSKFISVENLPEKIAKTNVLKNYDYIIQITKSADGSSKVSSIVELTPARTAALSVKIIAKLVDNDYITEFPQPLTSMRAGSISSRFSK